MSTCLFCQIAEGTIPSTSVHSDDDFFAFRDIDPKAPVHILLVPRPHVSGLNDIQEKDGPWLGRMMTLAADIARGQGLRDGGYRFVINCGDDGGQTVGHLHLHILGGRSLGWPPG